ncbi:MAG: YcjX family protein [Alphaproteobacteria bacterium]|nr:YcjX family protein [Alphaproteobacteria bacterium]
MAEPGSTRSELSRALDWLGARAGEAWRTAEALLGRRHLRLGITGLSGAGKTVFTTCLLQALTHASRHPHAMPLFAAASGAAPLVASIGVLEQLPRFPVEDNLAGLLEAVPRWPPPTERLCGARVVLSRGEDPSRDLTIDIVDYPGEWLLDLELLRLDYAAWSEASLARLAAGAGIAATESEAWRRSASTLDDADALVAGFTDLLHRLRDRGLRRLQPGRVLAPGDAPPAATEIPVPLSAARAASPIHATMAARYEAYRARHVEPFFREHFARLDRQIVLVDMIGALARGPEVLADTEAALESVLASFRYRRIAWLDWFRSRIDRVLVAATKVDHVTTSQYLNLRNLLGQRFEASAALEAIADDRIRFDVLSALRATSDGWIRREGMQQAAIRGTLKGADDTLRSLVPSDIPPVPPVARDWPEGGFVFHDFAPPQLAEFAAAPFPNVNLDKALDYLIGDRLT